MSVKKIYLPEGSVVYGKAVAGSDPWADDVQTISGTGPVYSADTDFPAIYVQLGGSPADTDVYVGEVTDLYYGSLAEGSIYHNARVHSWDWNQASEADRLRAMYHASTLIDQFRYICDKAVSTQVLEFPRTGETTVPLAIRQACYLIADALLSGRDPDEDFEAMMTKVETFGAVRTEFERAKGPQAHTSNLIPSPGAWALILPYLQISTSFDVNKS